jgi:hypothetical protein
MTTAYEQCRQLSIELGKLTDSPKSGISLCESFFKTIKMSSYTAAEKNELVVFLSKWYEIFRPLYLGAVEAYKAEHKALDHATFDYGIAINHNIVRSCWPTLEAARRQAVLWIKPGDVVEILKDSVVIETMNWEQQKD